MQSSPVTQTRHQALGALEGPVAVARVAVARVATTGGAATLSATLVAAFATGCAGSDGGSAQPAIVRDSTGVQIVENHAPAWTEGDGWRVSPEPAVRIGAVSGEPAYEFSIPRSMLRLSDGRIVVLDALSNEVRWFDGDGRHLATRGGAGEGPGEFNSAYALLRLPNDTIVVEDRPFMEHVFFDPNGDFVREELLDRDGVNALGQWVECFGMTLPDRSFLMCQAEPGLTIRPTEPGHFRSYSRFVRIPRTLDSAYTLGLYGGIEQWSIQDGERLNFAVHPFHARTVRAAGGTPLRIGIMVNPEYSLEVWTPDGRLERIVRRPDGRRAATPVEREDAEQALASYAHDDEATANRFIAEVQAPDSLPAAFRLTIGSQGDMWVLREGTLPSHDSALYDVFDRDGIFLGELRLPKGFTIFEVGADYVLGASRDANDVPFIDVYTLQR